MVGCSYRAKLVGLCLNPLGEDTMNEFEYSLSEEAATAFAEYDMDEASELRDDEEYDFPMAA